MIACCPIRKSVPLIETWSLELGVAARLLSQAGYYLHERAQYAQATPLLQRALAIYEKVLRPDHPNVATSLNNLAELYHSQGQYADAAPLYRRALAIREKVLGPDHPNVAESLNTWLSSITIKTIRGRRPTLAAGLSIMGRAYLLIHTPNLLARLYPLEVTLKAERQVCKVLLTLLPKEVRNVAHACHFDAMDCTICPLIVQAGVGARPGPDSGSAAGAGQTDRDGGVAILGLAQEPHFQNYTGAKLGAVVERCRRPQY